MDNKNFDKDTFPFRNMFQYHSPICKSNASIHKNLILIINVTYAEIKFGIIHRNSNC